MFTKIRKMLKSDKGFTLIELMVVIVILGILAGIGVPTYQQFINRAYKAEVEVAARTFRLGLELYRLDRFATDGEYPAVGHGAWEDDLEAVTELFFNAVDDDYADNKGANKYDPSHDDFDPQWSAYEDTEYINDWPENVLLVVYEASGSFELLHSQLSAPIAFTFPGN